MALEVQVYKDVRAYEAKIMFGMSWRQLGAAAAALVLGGGIYAAVTLALHGAGQSWNSATTWAMYAMFPVLIPLAAWGWWRPKGLKPEKYIGYVINYYATRKVVLYGDEYRGLDEGGAERGPSGKERRQIKKKEQENCRER